MRNGFLFSSPHKKLGFVLIFWRIIYLSKFCLILLVFDSIILFCFVRYYDLPMKIIQNIYIFHSWFHLVILFSKDGYWKNVPMQDVWQKLTENYGHFSKTRSLINNNSGKISGKSFKFRKSVTITFFTDGCKEKLMFRFFSISGV